jgi:anthranilate/para-aminobenzoate synthase component II
MHGKESQAYHDGQTIFGGLSSPITVGRYHSLVIGTDNFPTGLEISAKTEDGVIMAVRNRREMVEGVQFHPESILTGAGKDLLRNFLNL